jgi:hypothetical protein
MANQKTIVEEIAVKDLEDGSTLKVLVQNCTELGNQGKPGMQMIWMGNFVNYEPLACERWAYQAKKAGGGPLLLESESWIQHADQWIKFYFIPGTPAQARVEVKSRTSDPVIKDYPLPFNG